MNDAKKRIGVIGNPKIHRNHIKQILPLIMARPMPAIEVKPIELKINILAKDLNMIRDTYQGLIDEAVTMNTKLTMADLYQQSDEEIANTVREFIDFHNTSVSHGCHSVSKVIAIGADGIVLKFATDERESD